MRGRHGSRVVLVAGLAALVGCAYFNALYNANRLYERGRKEIRSGNEGAGRAALARSIEKAERLLERHPRSRWADDALRLIARARLLRREYAGAAEAAEMLHARAESHGLRLEAAGLLGRATLFLGSAERADSLLSLALSGSPAREERIELLRARGMARRQQNRFDEAQADLDEALRLAPQDASLRLARLYVLLDAGHTDSVAAEFQRALARPQKASVEEAILAAADTFARRAPEAARAALATVGSAPLRNSTRARLVVLRGRLTQAAGDVDSARADYERATGMAPGSDGAAAGYVALARLLLDDVASLDAIAEARELLRRATAVGVGERAGEAAAEANALASTIDRILQWSELGDVGWIAAGELARDALGGRALARSLFLEYVREAPDALWAPKAILAALALGPYDSGAAPGPDDEELREQLVAQYSESPYVEALQGGAEAAVDTSFALAERALQQRMQQLLRRRPGGAGEVTGERGGRRVTPEESDSLEDARQRRRPRPAPP